VDSTQKKIASVQQKHAVLSEMLGMQTSNIMKKQIRNGTPYSKNV